MREFKKEKGITLIALMVTIIVLIILAGISIGTLTGDEGIVDNAEFGTYGTKIRQYEQKVNQYVIKEVAKGGNSEIIVNIKEPEKIKEILGEIEEGDENKFIIQNNELRYLPDVVTEQEKEWLIKLNIGEKIGNYLLDSIEYYDTLQEAITNAQDGSVIEVINNTEETETLTIDKSITLDIKGKTINYKKNSSIIINENKNVKIEGNGTINGVGILNNGNLEINNINISSNLAAGYGCGTIVNIGTLNLNECIVDSIGFDFASSGDTGVVTINGGEYGTIRGENNIINSGNINYLHSGKCIINNGIINNLNVDHGYCLINSGTITDLDCYEASPIELIIGNINEEVNNNKPEIKSINLTGDHFDNSTFYFYNGIVKKVDWYDETIDIFNVVRAGYKIQTTTEGMILVAE